MSCDSDSAEFVRICNPPRNKTLDKYFPKEFSASEMSCLTGPYEYKVLPVMLHTLLMSSPTFLPFPKEVMGKYN